MSRGSVCVVSLLVCFLCAAPSAAAEASRVGPLVTVPTEQLRSFRQFYIPYADADHPFVYAVIDKDVVAFDHSMKEQHRARIISRGGSPQDVGPLAVTSEGVLFAISKGYLYRSTDQGKSFERVKAPQRFESPGHHSHIKLLAVDGEGNLLALHKWDKGRISVLGHGTSEPVLSDEHKIGTNTELYADKSGNLIVKTIDGVFRSGDRGRTLEPVKMPGKKGAYLRGMSFDGVMLATSNMKAWTSTDLGKSWKPLVVKRGRSKLHYIHRLKLTPHGHLLSDLTGSRTKVGTATLNRPRIEELEYPYGNDRPRFLDHVILAPPRKK